MVDGDDGDLQSERHRAICDVCTHARGLDAVITAFATPPPSLTVLVGPIVVPSIN